MKLTNQEKKLTKIDIAEITLFIVSLIVIVLFTVFIQNVQVSGKSMDSTLADGDMLIATRSNKELDYGDIVIVESKVLNEPIIKRVIAMGGDELTFKDNEVYVNGEKLEEDYINEDMTGNPDFSITIEKGTVWVMGDNRNHSGDSRMIGAVPLEEVSGELMVRYFPFTSSVNANEL